MMGSRVLPTVVTATIVLLVAGLTHLSAILILPSVATKDAFTLLQPKGAINRMTLLATDAATDRLIPFRDPSTVQAICYFDITKSPVRVKTKIEDGRLLTLSFRTPEGKIFYSMTDRAAFHDTIDIRLVTKAQLQDVEAGDDDDAGLPEELRLRAPQTKGLIVATALIARPGEAKDATDRLEAISCAPEPIAPPS